MTARLDPIPADSEAARMCLAAYFAELDERFGDGFQLDKTTSADAVETTPPRGQFLVLFWEEEPAGCGALKTLSPGVGEIKRMWLRSDLRGRGLGRRLLRELERWAIELDMRAVRLDTAAELAEARTLYQSAGYRPIPAYNDNPYAAHWFEKPLPG